MGRSSPAGHPAAEGHVWSRGVTMLLVAVMAIITIGTGSVILQLSAQHKGSGVTTAVPIYVQQELLSMQNSSSAQLSKLTDVVEQLQQQVSNLESEGMDRMHTAVNSTKQAVTEVADAVQRVFAHASSTGTKLDTLISTAAGVSKAAASPPAAAAAAMPCPSPSPAPRVKRLVVSMSSFPGRAEFAIPTVYSIM